MKRDPYTRLILGLLAACTVLLCVMVNLRAQAQEAELQFSIIPQTQGGTVWHDPDTLLYMNVRNDGSTYVTYLLDGTPYEGELVLLPGGSFRLSPLNQPETVIFSGRFSMDDEATLRLEPGRTGEHDAFLQGRESLVLTRICLQCAIEHEK